MLLDLINKHQKVGMILRARYPEVLDELLSKSPLDPNGANFVHETIYLAAHGMQSRPTCLVCGMVERRFHNIKKGYVPTCPSCKGKSEWRKQKFKQTCIDRYGASAPAGNRSIMNKIHSTKVSLGLFKTDEERSAYSKYAGLVHGLTQKQPLHLLENFDKRARSGVPGAYQVDHEFSVFDGFKMGVSPEIVANFVNLRMIPALENRKKWHNSSITLEQLLERIQNVKV